MARGRSAQRSARWSASIYGAEACFYLAVAGFGAQALVILVSPVVRLIRQPEMFEELQRAGGEVLKRFTAPQPRMPTRQAPDAK